MEVEECLSILSLSATTSVDDDEDVNDVGRVVVFGSSNGRNSLEAEVALSECLGLAWA